MISARKLRSGLSAWISVLLIAAAPLSAGGEGPCNPRRFEKRVNTEDGYKERRSRPDPYCEGEFHEPVAGHRQAGIVVCEYSLGPRPLSWKDGDEWRIAWPPTSGRSLIHGCHRDLSKQYEIDGEKTAPANAPGQPAMSAPVHFTWLTRLAKTKGFNTTDVQFRVDVPNTAKADGKTEWPELPAQTTVFVPARISAAGAQPASKPAETPASEKAPRLRVCIAANKTTKIKSATATRVGGNGEKREMESWANRTLDRASLSFDLHLPHDGAVWRIEILLEDAKDRVTPAVPFYVQAPPAEFVNSPAK